MRSVDERHRRRAQLQAFLDSSGIDYGGVKWRALKGIGKTALKPLQSARTRVKRNWATGRLGNLTEVVDAMAMVGMVVGDDHTGQIDQLGCEQLRAHVGTAIDKQVIAVALNHNRGAGAPVSRFAGIARAPVIADAWYAGRRSAAEDPDFHRWALLNNRKKLPVVAEANSSALSPRNAARKAAVSATNAGSQV